ncbi:MAG TPA: hypothetical protein VGE35_02000 [Candidatus Paceibacterota bacterium]
MNITLTPEQNAKVGPEIVALLAKSDIDIPVGHTAEVSVRIISAFFPSVEIVHINPELDKKLAAPARSLTLKKGSQGRFVNSIVNRGNLHTIGELVRSTDEQLLALHNVSKGTVAGVKDALSEIGLSTGMKMPVGPQEKEARRQRRLCIKVHSYSWSQSTIQGIPDGIMLFVSDSGFYSAHQFLNGRSKDTLVRLLGQCTLLRENDESSVKWLLMHPTGECRYQVIFDAIYSHCNG